MRVLAKRDTKSETPAMPSAADQDFIDLRDDVIDGPQAAGTFVTAREKAFIGSDENSATFTKCCGVVSGCGMRPHFSVHRWCDDKRCARGESDACECVFGQAASKPCQCSRGGRGNQQQIRAVGQGDVTRAPIFLFGKKICCDRIFAECLQRERADEFLSGCGHDGKDVVSTFYEQAGQISGFVSGDGSGDPEYDCLACGHVRIQGR